MTTAEIPEQVGAPSLARQRVYAALLTTPDRDWTVGQMAEAVPDVPVTAVRTILHLLLGHGVLVILTEAHRPALTLCLPEPGRLMLTTILQEWGTNDIDGSGGWQH